MLKDLDIYKRIQNEIETFKQDTGNDTLWFRGERKEYPAMKSSLTRELTEKPDLLEKAANILSVGQHTNAIKFERWAYQKFVERTEVRYPDDTMYNPVESWAVEYYAQHYGVPTRFLDWTVSLETALYFACNNLQDNKDSVLWLLDPCEFNQLTSQKHYVATPNTGYLEFLTSQVFAKHPPIALYPEHIHTNYRAQSQSGYFLYTSNICDIVRYIMEHTTEPNKIYRKIVIPHQEALKIRQQNSITDSDLYLDGRDLTGLSYFEYRRVNGLLDGPESQKEMQRLYDERNARIEAEIERNGG